MYVIYLHIHTYLYMHICKHRQKAHYIQDTFRLILRYFFGAVEKVFKEIKRNTSSLKCVNSMEKNNNIFCKIF